MTEETAVANLITNQTIELICFTLDDQEFGVPITKVKEIIQPPPITNVVHTPDLIEGVINIRGVIIVVLNIKKLLNFSNSQKFDDQKIVIVHDDDKTAGLLVDNIEIVKQIDIKDINHLESQNDGNLNYYDGVVQLENSPLTILSVSKILSAPDLTQFQAT